MASYMENWKRKYLWIHHWDLRPNLEEKCANWRNPFLDRKGHQGLGLNDIQSSFERWDIFKTRPITQCYLSIPKEVWSQSLLSMCMILLQPGNNVAKIGRLKGSLAKEFEVKDLGNLRYFLDIEVARLRCEFFCHQESMLRIYLRTGMVGYRPSDTLINASHKLEMPLQ